ncbi:MAG: hypothetical protein WD042_06215 [Phycisphaeraceae bacterium]
MSKRAMMTLAAVAVALIALLVTLWLKPEDGGAQRDPMTIEAGQIPPPLTDDAIRRAEGDPSPRSIHDYVVETKTKKGALIQIFGKTYRPLPNAQSEVTLPIARIFLSATRVIEIRADEGSFYAPGNTPRTGTLVGHVVISFFDAPPGKAVNLHPQQGDLQMRLFMKEARFDLELGQIDCDEDQPVYVTAPRFDFRGKGLTMTYNELRKRIDHLEVFTGEALRIQGSVAAGSGGTGAAGAPGVDRAGPPGAEATPQAVKPSTQPAEEEKQPLWYRARFLDDVKVANPDMTITGDLLWVQFSLEGRQDQGQQNRGQTPGSGSGAGAAGAPGAPGAGDPGADASAATSVVQQSAATAPLHETPPERSLMTQTPDDTLITWTGRMIVQPEPEPSPELADASDALLAVEGRRVEVVTSRQEHIEAVQVQYLLSRDEARVLGDDKRSVTFDSPQLGIMKSPRMVIDQSTGRGVVYGPGILRGAAEGVRSQEKGDGSNRLAGDAQRPAQTSDAGLPPDMVIFWNDRLDLAFASRSAQHGQDGASRIGPLEKATFREHVRVTQRQMDLEADTLTLAMSKPAAKAPAAAAAPDADAAAEPSRPAIESILAQGNARIVTKDAQAQPSTTVQGDWLTILMKRNEAGRSEPDRFVARGHVKTQGQGRQLSADALDAALETAGSDPAAPAQAAGAGQLRIKGMTATGDVHISVDQPQTTMTGDTAMIDAVEDVLVLTSQRAQQPARLVQPQGELVGGHIVLRQRDKTVDVKGPGTFTYVEKSDDPNTPPTTTVVTWKESMHLDNKQGFAHFKGEAVADSKGKLDTGRLSGQTIDMGFETAGESPPASAAQQAPGGRVKTVMASQNAQFQSETWQDQPGGKLATRLTIKGPRITFTRDDQKVVVPGPKGSMLFEDYRVAEQESRRTGEQEAERGTRNAAPAASFVGGRGQTLFTWDGQLTFDIRPNDMVIQKNVGMIHRPAGSKEVNQLASDRLVADLESTGGLAVWLSGSAPTPKLTKVNADGHVVVTTSDRVIHTDHLSFFNKEQTVLLKADDGKLTEVEEKGQAQPYTAKAIKWDLVRNRLEVIEPGPTRVPVRQRP